MATMDVGWNVRVTIYDEEGKPSIQQHFLVYEADKKKAVALVHKWAPVYDRETMEATAPVPLNEFIRYGMKPGEVRRHDQ